MSTGSAPTPLLKAAPEPEQLADRFDDGDWRGIELCLAGRHVADDAALARAVAVAREGVPSGRAVTAEAPVAWPSGAFVRVDRLDDEARAGIERSAEFARGVGSPVLTIHLFAPMDPDEYRRGERLDEDEVERFLSFYARACAERGVAPLIENVPPILRMRTGGVFLSPVGGHWRDLLVWRERVPELGFTLDVSHAALFRNVAHSYPSLFDLASAVDLEPERYVDELGPVTEVAHVSDAEDLLGEGLPYGAGDLDLDPLVKRLGAHVPFIVAEINEPDPARSPAMKAAYRAIERALELPSAPARPRARRLAEPYFDWQAVTGRRDPVPAVLALRELLAGRRVLVTGGAGSVGRVLTSFLEGFGPSLIAVLDVNEAALAADRRARPPVERRQVEHVLCDVRDADRLRTEMVRAAPDVVFHLAAYKHVDMAERYPEEFVATNLEGSLALLNAADALECGTVVVASTDKAALRASLYARTKQLMEQLTATSARRTGAPRLAARLVNVLGSAGSASELFMRQSRAGVPLTVTDSGMVRYWITLAHAVALLVHGALAAAEGECLATAADPATFTVGEVAERVWRQAGREGEPELELVGVRPGETMSELLVGEGERLLDERVDGCAVIAPTDEREQIDALLSRLGEAGGWRARRAVWLDAIRGGAGTGSGARAGVSQAAGA
jgi:nucleoside-diphosphate-sugar epimerase/sugar phosphate isomerase/epimerase